MGPCEQVQDLRGGGRKGESVRRAPVLSIGGILLHRVARGCETLSTWCLEEGSCGMRLVAIKWVCRLHCSRRASSPARLDGLLNGSGRGKGPGPIPLAGRLDVAVAAAVTAAVAKSLEDGAPMALGVSLVADEAIATPTVDLTVRKNERLDEQRISTGRPNSLLASLRGWRSHPRSAAFPTCCSTGHWR